MLNSTFTRAAMGIVLSCGILVPAHGDQELAARHQAVLALQPVGYWPADDGQGEVLRDLSENRNHGTIHHVPWDDGLLDFTSAYQQAVGNNLDFFGKGATKDSLCSCTGCQANRKASTRSSSPGCEPIRGRSPPRT